MVSTGADTRTNIMGWCALERGHVALLEPLAQLGDALRGVGAATVFIKAAELVPGQAATREQGVCQWALTRNRTLLGGGALERGHGASLEPLAQLGDALRGVGAVAMTVDAAELDVGQTAKEG